MASLRDLLHAKEASYTSSDHAVADELFKDFSHAIEHGSPSMTITNSEMARFGVYTVPEHLRPKLASTNWTLFLEHLRSNDLVVQFSSMNDQKVHFTWASKTEIAIKKKIINFY